MQQKVVTGLDSLSVRIPKKNSLAKGSELDATSDKTKKMEELDTLLNWFLEKYSQEVKQ